MRQVMHMASWRARADQWETMADRFDERGERRLATTIRDGLARQLRRRVYSFEVPLRFRDGSIAKVETAVRQLEYDKTREEGEGYPLPGYVKGLMRAVEQHISIALGNCGRGKLDEWEDYDLDGMTWHPYYEDDKPNFVFQGVEIRWYKHSWRGLESNRMLSEIEWITWYDNLRSHLHEWSRKAREERDAVR